MKSGKMEGKGKRATQSAQNRPHRYTRQMAGRTTKKGTHLLVDLLGGVDDREHRFDLVRHLDVDGVRQAPEQREAQRLQLEQRRQAALGLRQQVRRDGVVGIALGLGAGQGALQGADVDARGGPDRLVQLPLQALLLDLRQHLVRHEGRDVVLQAQARGGLQCGLNARGGAGLRGGVQVGDALVQLGAPLAQRDGHSLCVLIA